MMVLVNRFKALTRDVGINLRSRYIGMPKQQLHNP
jgi:hypothetical protein